MLIGSLFLLIALICGVNYRLVQQRLTRTPESEDPTVSSLATLAQEMGEAAFKQDIVLQGEMVCQEVLISPLAERECVAFESTVLQEWEDAALPGQKGQRNTEIISQETDSLPFWLNDGTGEILVNPNQAEIAYIEVLHLFEPARTRTSPLQIGTFTLSPGEQPQTPNRRLVGFHFSEKIFPREGYLYVQGQAICQSGELQVQSAVDMNRPFLISHQSEPSVDPDDRMNGPVYQRIGWLSLVMGFGMCIAGWFGF